jgi:2-oxoglutarate dehydrogenase E2 component (dihydrolipoamide succinyltransferase)
MAREHDVDLGAVQGSGTSGRVMKQDVQEAIAKPAPAVESRQAPAPRPPAVAPARPSGDRSERRERMSKRRETIARLAALRAFPQLNAEIQGNEIVYKNFFDIGMAVGAEGGLVVPVVRDADRLSFAQLELGIRDFAKRAADGTLTLDDLKGGTFTITNGGVFGSLLSTPILNPPQVAILGLHKIQDRAVPVNGQVAIRPMMYVALSYDHRIVDGREAVQFLVKIKEFIEDPGHLLLES